MSKPYPADILDKLIEAIAAWKSVDPNLKVLGASVTDLETLLQQGQDVQRQINAQLVQLTNLRNQRDAIHKSGWKHIKHLRLAVKGRYGDDSSEYEVVGGTRASERKPRTRRARPNNVTE